MTKAEVIQAFYERVGFDWSQAKQYVSENGFLVLPTPDLKYSLIGYSNLINEDRDKSVYLSKDGLHVFPSALKGIHNNNGWIKLESELDLPKEGYVFWVIRKGIESPLYKVEDFFNDDINKLWMETYTHYLRIDKPLPPIY